jgi:hypothetical protein
MLLKLELLGYITLPHRRSKSVNGYRNRSIPDIIHDTQAITCNLGELSPVVAEVVRDGYDLSLFRTFLSKYHYLGYSGSVGENLKYLVFDRQGRPLACLLFGSAAWKTAPRDRYIGWDDLARRRNLALVTNNMRFLIMPWVKVAHLASYVLGYVSRRICSDWEERYGHPVHLLETFVDTELFRGTCYRAANWIYVGQTKGRTRNDRNTRIRMPLKDMYLYPLDRHAFKMLRGGQ